MSAAPDRERTEPGHGATGRALVPFKPPEGRAFPWPSYQQGLLVAAFGLAMGVGVAGMEGSRSVTAAWTQPPKAASAPDPQAALILHLQDEVGRLQASIEGMRAAAEVAKPDEPLRGLRRSVDVLKQDLDQVRQSGAASVAQLAAKLDKPDHDPSAKLAEIAARLDRMEHAPFAGAKAAEPQSGKVADLASRVERIEKRVSAATPTGSIPPAAAAHAAIVQAAPGRAVVPQAMRSETTLVPAFAPKPPPTLPAPLNGWVLRDVYDGVALVQARGGGLREVGPGEYLPGAGEVRSIERRGRGWVILTSRGVIDSATF